MHFIQKRKFKQLLDSEFFPNYMNQETGTLYYATLRKKSDNMYYRPIIVQRYSLTDKIDFYFEYLTGLNFLADKYQAYNIKSNGEFYFFTHHCVLTKATAEQLKHYQMAHGNILKYKYDLSIMTNPELINDPIFIAQSLREINQHTQEVAYGVECDNIKKLRDKQIEKTR